MDIDTTKKLIQDPSIACTHYTCWKIPTPLSDCIINYKYNKHYLHPQTFSDPTGSIVCQKCRGNLPHCSFFAYTSLLINQNGPNMRFIQKQVCINCKFHWRARQQSWQISQLLGVFLIRKPQIWTYEREIWPQPHCCAKFHVNPSNESLPWGKKTQNHHLRERITKLAAGNDAMLLESMNFVYLFDR